MKKLKFKQAPSLPLIMQDERAECGHACIAMISHYWGMALDLFNLRAIDKPSVAGVTLRHLSELLDRLGFRTRALSVPLDEIKCIKTPAILHWNMNHFVVLKEVKRNSVVIHDPAQGLRIYSMAEVSKAFTGIVLEVEPVYPIEQLQDKTKLNLLSLLKTMRGIGRSFLFLFLLSLMIEGIALINPLFLQYITDYGISAGDLSNLFVFASGFFILIVTHGLFDYIRSNFLLYLGMHLTEQFSSNVMRHLLRLPLSFFESRQQGDIQSKFQSIDQIQRKISVDFMHTLLDGLVVLIHCIVMFCYSGLLTGLVLISLSFCILMRYVSYLSYRKAAASGVHLHGMTASIFLETLRGMLPIKAYAQEGLRFRRWHNRMVDALNADIRTQKLQNVYQVMNQLIPSLELLLVIVLGAYFVMKNHLTIGMLMAFLSYRLVFVNKSLSCVQQLFDYQLISIQLNRLSDILYQKPEKIDETLNADGITLKHSFSLKNISFKYDAMKENLFHAFNIEIFRGEKVAIVGSSGSGKTTLLKIMMGLLLPSVGEVTVDGLPIDKIGLKRYRRSIASVMQEDTLFSGSIIENIIFFEDVIDFEYAYQVARWSCIHETIMALPMGYETLIGDMGSLLSGGQKQRLLLARALYKRPQILFLDEATSHLDEENEQQINRALKALNITQIIVAHREKTIAMADRVIPI